MKAELPRKVNVDRPCTRCAGTGHYHGYGTCFRCGGGRVDPHPKKVWVFPEGWTKEQVTEFYQDKETKQQQARDRHEARKEAKRQKVLEGNPLVARVYEGLNNGEDVSFIASDICRKALKGWSLSERQLEVLEQEVLQLNDKRDNPVPQKPVHPVPTGRITIIAEVIGRKVVDNDFGSVMKLMLEGADGWKVWVSEPRGIYCEVGDTVQMTCTVTAGEDDLSFGFGSRPTKAEIVSRTTKFSKTFVKDLTSAD